MSARSGSTLSARPRWVPTVTTTNRLKREKPQQSVIAGSLQTRSNMRTYLASGFAVGVSFSAIVFGLGGCARPPHPIAVTEIHPGYLQGYLATTELPDSFTLLPPPPASGSWAEKADSEYSRASQTVRGSAREKMATADAELAFPAAARSFSCALGVRITDAETPYLYQLLRRSLTDAALSTYRAKNTYNRARPFAVENGSTCTPAEELALRKDGSYPSGHAAIGWAWALILSELSPRQTSILVSRGLSYGDSRVVCNVHWKSDIETGRLMGAATVARLHGSNEFLADMKAAKAEIRSQQAEENTLSKDECADEAKGLAVRFAAP